MKQGRMISIAALAVAGVSAANAQTFSKQMIDTNGLADFQPGSNACTDPDALQSHACQPWLPLIKAIEPPPASERAVVSAAAVLQLCGAHNIKDVVCGEATLLELRFHKMPCWENNKC